MAKGKSTWKYNKLLTARRNYFAYAGPIDTVDEGGQSDTVDTTNSSNIFKSAGSDIKMAFTNPGAALKSPTMGMTSLVGAAAGAIGGIGGKLLSNGLESKAGNIISGVGDAVGGIPIVGGFAKGALNLIGGGVNALFGSKLNKENIAAVEGGVSRANSATASAQSFDTLASQMGAAADISGFNKKFIGKDGLFSNKAGKKFRDLREEANRANNRQALTMATNAQNITEDTMSNLAANYAAFGGPLGFTGGAIDYGFMTDYLNTKRLAAAGQNDSMTSLPNSFAKGGGMTHGADFTNGLLAIDNGGSHETNPLEGVPMGVDQEGTPNLVEEGETIFNDYVFSKRLMVPKAIRKKYKLRGTKNISFADASKQLAKESEERPNDPVSERGMQALMADLASAQEELKAKNQENSFALGGKVNKFKVGGDKLTPYKNYTQLSKDTDFYTPEYLRFWDYMNDAANIEEANKWLNRINSGEFGTIGGNTFTLADIQRLSRDYKQGPVHNAYKIAAAQYAKDNPVSTPNMLPEVVITPEEEPASPIKHMLRQGPGNSPILMPESDIYTDELVDGYSWNERFGNKYKRVNTTPDNGVLYYDPIEQSESQSNTEEYKQGKYADWLRYAPAVGFGIGAITDAIGLTNRPNYSNADAILEATRSAGTYEPVEFNPIGNYLRYTPFDRDFYINKLNAESGATRRAALQNAGLNRGAGMAAILAADATAQNSIGQLARQAEEYNLAQRQQVEDFNRTTNITNSQGMLQADTANQKAQADMRDFSLKGTLAAAQMREQARIAADAAKSANLSGLFQTLGDIGFEEKNARMRDWAIRHGVFGPGTEDYGRVKSTTKAKGGKVKRRKRGLTF